MEQEGILEEVSLEEQALIDALAQKLATRWPRSGDVVVVAEEWDGPAAHGSENFLYLHPGDRVVVKERNAEGLLYGTVKGEASQSGWFGGPGCLAAMQITLHVPMGNQRTPTAKAETPSDHDRDPDLEAEVDIYLTDHGVDEKATLALKALSPELQKEIVSTPITNCRNPSAVLLSRIERIRTAAAASNATAGSMEESWDEVPSQLAMAVDTYLMDNGVDEKASSALRGLAPELQQEIIRTEMSNCRNPSAVLLSRVERIRAASAAAVDFPRGGSSLMPPPRAGTRPRSRSPAPRAGSNGVSVEEFIASVCLDTRVAIELRSLPLDEQLQVINTDLRHARNPSAVVNSRIQTVRTWEAQRHAVQEYIQRHSIDDVATHALLALPPEMQQLVVRSDLSNARNPSAVLLTRIRAVESQASQAGLGLTGLPAVVAPQPAPPRPSGGRPSSVPLSRSATSGVYHSPIGLAQHSSSARGSSQPPPPSAPPPAALLAMAPMATRAAVEDYIRLHKLDDKVAQEMRSISPMEQQQVMSSNITNARNPSAIVSSRIQNIRGQQVQAQAQAQAMPTSMVEAYLFRHPVDDNAARALRELPLELQLRIIEQDLSNCRNPSAVLLSRCRSLATNAGLPPTRP